VTKALPEARPLLVSLPFRVQTYDIDFAGHVNNGVYLRWLEDLRTEMLCVYYPLQKLMAQNMAPILYATSIVYRRSIQLFEEPVGRMWCTTMGRSSLSLHAEIWTGEALCTTASQRAILLHLGTTKAARLPQELLDHFHRENVAP